MKRFEITEESLEKALAHGRDSDSSCVKWHELFYVLKALCVPVELEALEEWEQYDGCLDRYYKREYTLMNQGLFKEGKLIAPIPGLFVSHSDAKVWADKIIAEREAGEEAEWINSPDLKCFFKGDYRLTNNNRWELRRTSGLDAFQPFSKIQRGCVKSAKDWADGIIEKIKKIEQPKPQFGPGTRLRAKNGDEVEITANNTFCAINTKTNLVFIKGLVDIWMPLEQLQQALTAAGYKVIK